MSARLRPFLAIQETLERETPNTRWLSERGDAIARAHAEMLEDRVRWDAEDAAGLKATITQGEPT